MAPGRTTIINLVAMIFGGLFFPCFAVPSLENPRITKTVGPSVELVGSNGQVLRGGIENGVGERELDGCLELSRLFIGTMYVRDPSFELLPLWGNEEGQLLALIEEAICDSLDAETIDALRATRRFLEIPPGVTWELWKLVNWVTARKEKWLAVQDRRLGTKEGALRAFSIDSTVALQSLSRDGAMIYAYLLDSEGDDLWIISEDEGCDWYYWFWPGARPLEGQFGCSTSLSIITLLDYVLQDGGTATERIDPELLCETRSRVNTCRVRTLDLLLNSLGKESFPR